MLSVSKNSKWVTVQERGFWMAIMPAIIPFCEAVHSKKFVDACGVWTSDWLVDFEDDNCRFFVEESSWNDFCHRCYLKVKEDPKIQIRLIKEFLKRTPKFLSFCQNVYKSDLEKESNKKLWQYYQKYIRLYKDLYIWGEIFAFGARFELGDYLENYLKGKRENPDIFYLLIQPEQKSFITKEKEELLKIGLKILKDKKAKELFGKNLNLVYKEIENFPILNILIEKHTAKYQWVPYNYSSYLFDKKYFIKELKSLIVEDKVAPELEKINKLFNSLKERQKKIVEELKIDEYHQNLFEALRLNSFIIDFKKEVFSKSHFYINFSLMREIARRLKIKQKLAHSILEEEMRDALLKNKIVPLEILEQRYNKCVVLIGNNNFKLTCGGEAYRFLKTFNIVSHTADKEIKGQIANLGKIIGKVKILTGPKDFYKIKKGEILVAPMTTPEFVPILKKAAAIVTDEGGITSHAAIVARELNIPCIIGTKVATKVLKDGDLIEVNAEKGLITILS